MATIEQLSQALVNADRAGDVDAARALAAEITRMRSAPQPSVSPEMRSGPSGQHLTFEEGQALLDQEEAKDKYERLPWYLKAPQAAMDTANLMAHGASLGFSDKAAAGVVSALSSRTYDEALAEMKRKHDLEMARAGSAGYAAELAGAVATPMKLAKEGGTLIGRFGTGAMEGVKGLAARSGLAAFEGAGYGGLTAAGNDQDIGTGAAFGGLGGAFGNVVGEGISSGVSKIAGLFNKKPAIPTLDELSALKDAAYKSADAAGVAYTPQAVDKINASVVTKLTDLGYDPALMPGAAVAVKRLQDLQGQNVTLAGLDTIRKIASNGYIPGNKANNSAITEIINSIDDLVDNAGAADVLMGSSGVGAQALKEARSLASRLSKSAKVEGAVEKASLRAASTGSGGNVDNATRQILRRLLENPRGFTPDERAALEAIVRGTPGQNTLRLAGKLSPSGNGLMAALGIGGTMVNPAIGALSLGGMGAKAAADALTRKNINELTNIILAGGDASATKAAPNAVQKLAQSKRDAIVRALMAIGAYESGSPAR